MAVYLFRKLPNQKVMERLQEAVFFIAFFLCLWLIIDLRFIYAGGSTIVKFPIFYRGWSFFAEITAVPGGLAEYISAFFAQFFYYSWAGAIVVTVQAWLFTIFASALFKTFNVLRFTWIRLIPAVIIFYLYSKYTYFFDTMTALLIALVFTVFYLKIMSVNKAVLLAIFSVLSVLLYMIAGPAYLFFAVMCVVYEFLVSRHHQLALIKLLLAAVIVYVEGVLIFKQNVVDSFINLPPISMNNASEPVNNANIILIYLLYLFFPLVVIRFSETKTVVSESKESALNSTLSVLAFCVIAGGVVFFAYDKSARNSLAVNYFTANKVWPQVLKHINCGLDDSQMIFQANRALFYTERLAYDLFAYPQKPENLFLEPALTSEKGNKKWQKVDFYIDLGFINYAEYYALVCLDEFGERPEILKRLALINMVKGSIDAARVYLTALSKTLFYSGWADEYLNKIAADSSLSSDSRIQYLRSIMLEKDYIISVGCIDIEKLLSALLDKNKHNKMAFEYQMSFYLLNRQLDKLVQNLNRLNDFVYPDNIPTLYEEALLIHKYRTNKNVDLGPCEISPESIQRYVDFTRIRNKGSFALNELKQKYGHSYYFYYFYGPSGLKK